MAIHYDKKRGQFRDDSGRFVSKARAMRSSVARAEYQKATRQPAKKAAPKAKTTAKPSKEAKPSKTPKPSKPAKPAKPKREPGPRSKKRKPAGPKAPWLDEGIVREYPDPEEWFPEVDFYGYDDLIVDWGDYDDEETES